MSAPSGQARCEAAPKCLCTTARTRHGKDEDRGHSRSHTRQLAGGVILVDTNVLLDGLQDDPKWADWSQGQLEAASLTERLAINAVIYSELSMAFARIEELEVVIADAA